MSTRKRKKRKRRSVPGGQKARSRRPSLDDLQTALSRADRLISRGRTQAAIELLEPLLDSYPREADLHYYLGYAHAKAGDTWGALAGYERAQELSRDLDYWLPLASLYLETELRAHALRAFRQALKHQADIPFEKEARETVAALEEGIAEIARDLGLPARQVEKGLYHMEHGQRALNENDFPASIAASRKAIKSLHDWPPPHNNLSLALFWNGQPEEAIATARQVLSRVPNNVHALSNGIRFLAWTGREADARALWPRLQDIASSGHSEWIKIVEAAAILGKDEHVYQLLHAGQGKPSEFTTREQYFLAVAEANTGRRQAAQRRFKALRKEMPWASELLAALKARRPGPGWAERFPYFHSIEHIPLREMNEFVELATRQDELPTQRFRSQVARFAARFPQIVLMAEKLIWEEDQPDAGITFLTTIATPAAYAALRRFGLSQAGEDDTRMEALSHLMRTGEIRQDETLRVWIEGEWRDVQMRQYEVSGEQETGYIQEVADLLNQGLSILQQGDPEQAEQLFRRALELEPHAKEAYNNLGAIYARRGDHAQAKESFQAALEIEPLYVFPRCNLASYLLDDDDITGAEAMLKPLADTTHFHAQEMAFYSYTQARILVRKEEYDAARQSLRVALKVYPGYDLAQNLLERLDMISKISTGFESYRERQRRRDQAKRARLQAKLSTPEPTLDQALPLYTKNLLTGMGRVVLQWGGWAALRKAELIQEIVEGLDDLDNLERIVADLNDEEQTALRQVLASGGAMPWQDFDADFGNDLEESPYWQWHVPETTMGRLRLRGLLVETTVDGELLVAIPSELRTGIEGLLGDIPQ